MRGVLLSFMAAVLVAGFTGLGDDFIGPGDGGGDVAPPVSQSA